MDISRILNNEAEDEDEDKKQKSSDKFSQPSLPPLGRIPHDLQHPQSQLNNNEANQFPELPRTHHASITSSSSSTSTATPTPAHASVPLATARTVKRRRSSESAKPPSSYMFVPGEFQRRQHRSKSESKMDQQRRGNPVIGGAGPSQSAESESPPTLLYNNANPLVPLPPMSPPDPHYPPLPPPLPPGIAGHPVGDSMIAVQHHTHIPSASARQKRTKAKNSTWTLEEDRQLVDLILNTLPVQDYAEYARILNKRDAQTVRYRWRVIIRRAKGEGP